MTIGGRARLGIVVSLGILAGIGLVGLPSLLLIPPPSVASPSTRTNSTSGFTTGMGLAPGAVNGRSNTTTTPTSAGDTPVTPGSLATLLSLIVAPAVAISLVGTVFVSRKSRKRTNRLSEHE